MYRFFYKKNISFIYFESKEGSDLVRTPGSSSKDIVVPFNVVQSNLDSVPNEIDIISSTPIACIPGHPSFEKGSFDLLAYLIDLCERGLYDYTTLIPESLAKSYDQCLPENFVLVGAHVRDSYLWMINKADIALFNYQPDHYFYRHSGVILDCAAARTFVICPDFPLLQSMISYPTPIGLSFGGLSELPSLLATAHGQIIQKSIDWHTYHSQRSLPLILKGFNSEINAR